MSALKKRMSDLARPTLTRGGRLFLPLLALGYLVGALAYGFVGLVDPYDLRASGMKVRLADQPYRDAVVPRLVSMVAKSDADLVVVGGSSVLGFSDSKLRLAFPEARHPFNLAFAMILSEDYKTLLASLNRSTALKRAVVALDFTLARDTALFGEPRTRRYQGARWYDPVPEFELESLRASAAVVRTGVLDVPGWLRSNPESPEFLMGSSAVTEHPAALNKLRLAARESHDWVVASDPVACAHLPSLRTILLPGVRQLAARGVKVDLVIPPYSLAVYSDWTANFQNGRFFQGRGMVWAHLMGMRRCVLEAFEGVEGVSVHAFDTDVAITGNLSLYSDSSHIRDLTTYGDMLMRIARRQNTLTLAGWPAYAEALKKAVLEFAP